MEAVEEVDDANFVLGSRLTDEALQTAAQTLVARGAVAIPVIDPQWLPLMQVKFNKALQEFPEYLRDPKDPTLVQRPDQSTDGPQHIKYVLGSFGALGNPGSFHNSFVRNLRWRLHEQVVPLFSRMRAAGEDRLTNQHKVHVIPDRMRILTHDAKISAESWHRDTTPQKFTLDDDIIFGGWVNLDPVKPQRLSALLDSHRVLPDLPEALSTTGHEGFATFSEDDQAMLTAYRDTLKVDDTEVIVPPGHLLIFYQELIHEVVPRPKIGVRALAANPDLARPEYRLFTAWRLTRDASALLPTLPGNYFSDMEVPHLKSNQAARMYPPTYYEFGAPAGAEALYAWCKRQFSWAMCTRRDRFNKRIIPATLPSLRTVCSQLALEFPPSKQSDVDEEEQEFYLSEAADERPLYKPYTAAEEHIYRPHFVFMSKDSGNPVTFHPQGVGQPGSAPTDPIIIDTRRSV